MGDSTDFPKHAYSCFVFLACILHNGKMEKQSQPLYCSLAAWRGFGLAKKEKQLFPKMGMVVPGAQVVTGAQVTYLTIHIFGTTWALEE